MSNKSWAERLTGLGFMAMCIAVILLIVVGPGHRFGIVPTKIAVLSTAAATLIAVFAVLLTIIGLLLRGKSGSTLKTGRVALTLLIAGGISLQLIGWIGKARAVPAIHDITTDTVDPPQFVALVSARANAANPLAYGGEEVAEQQRTAYPDIDTISLAGVTQAAAISAADAAARGLGLDPVIVKDNQIEATDTTFWYGYKDDVIIRVRETDNGSDIDIRSKSRVGQSDLGTNAERVRALQSAIARELGSG